MQSLEKKYLQAYVSSSVSNGNLRKKVSLNYLLCILITLMITIPTALITVPSLQDFKNHCVTTDTSSFCTAYWCTVCQ